MNQKGKAQQFAALHVPGRPIVLYNIWDAGSAVAVEKSGAQAVATGSWPVAAAQGFQDGQKIPLELLLGIAERVCASVDVPVSIDFEAGYGATIEDITTNVARVIDAGAVGINFEDQIIGGKGLNEIGKQCESIKAIRELANARDFLLFINARTDLFLKAAGDEHRGLMADAKARASAYAEAGASGFFAPGLLDESMVKELCDSSDLPVNIIRLPGAPSTQVLASLGVARVSYGPVAYRQLMGQFTEEAKSHLQL